MNAKLQPNGNPYGNIQPEQIKSAAEFTDDAALKLVVQDAERTQTWLDEKQWSLQWKEADTLYQSPRFLSPWEGTTVTKANVTRFTVAKHINSIVPTLVSGIFYEDPCFLLRPRPGTSQETIRAKSALYAYELSEMGFYGAVKLGFQSAALFGTAIWKWGWLSETKKQKVYQRKRAPMEVDTGMGKLSVNTAETDEIEIHEIERRIDRPFFDQIDIRHVMVDPGCRVPDIRQAKFVIHRMYLNQNDLELLRDIEGYDIPSADDLSAIFDPQSGEQPALPGTAESINALGGAVHHAAPRYEKTTVDPLANGLEILERWDNDKVVVVLNRKWVIRNEQNPFGVIPFYSSNWWNIPDAFWGMGIGRIIGQDQRVEQGLTNAALDILAMAVNPQYIRSRGANVPTQQIRQRLGGIIDVDGNVREAFALMEPPKVPAEVWAAIQASQANAESASGANDMLVQGSTGGAKSSITRTATGAGGLMNAVTSRLQDPVENFIHLCFEPWLVQMDELNNERLPMGTLRHVLGEELGKDYQLDEEGFLNARIKFEALAGAHLSAKRGMAQFLPLMIQLFDNPQTLGQLNQTGWTIDLKELIKMFCEASEWKNTYDVIRKLTPEETQAFQQATGVNQKLETQKQLEDQKFDHQSQLVDQENTARAAREVLRQTLTKTETPIALTGEPGGKGFGSEV